VLSRRPGQSALQDRGHNTQESVDIIVAPEGISILLVYELNGDLLRYGSVGSYRPFRGTCYVCLQSKLLNLEPLHYAILNVIRIALP
jgi:hypothetical protein